MIRVGVEKLSWYKRRRLIEAGIHMRVASFLLLGTALLFCATSGAQILLVDRGLTAGSQVDSLMVGRHAPGFVGDQFKIGSSGEVWIIESLRVWGSSDAGSLASGRLGGRYEKVALFGGIENIPTPGQAECDCHNLAVIQSASLRAGTDDPDGGNVRVAKLAGNLWEIEFRNLYWSVPGGVSIEYGVLGTDRTADGRSRGNSWRMRGSKAHRQELLRLFDENGKLQLPSGDSADAVEPAAVLNVQVRGHRSVPVAANPAKARTN